MRQRHNMRLVYSEDDVKRRQAKARVYPKAATCFHCRARFEEADARQIVENDGVCDPCAEKLDSFSRRSEQGVEHAQRV